MRGLVFSVMLVLILPSLSAVALPGSVFGSHDDNGQGRDAPDTYAEWLADPLPQTPHIWGHLDPLETLWTAYYSADPLDERDNFGLDLPAGQVRVTATLEGGHLSRDLELWVGLFEDDQAGSGFAVVTTKAGLTATQIVDNPRDQTVGIGVVLREADGIDHVRANPATSGDQQIAYSVDFEVI